MPSHITKYKILIASPSDIVKERALIPEIIKDWNDEHSDYYGVELKPLLWEIDATPEMGKPAQDVINEQLVKDCDILVGIFWTRLGTHTGKAESGTIEEIEEALKDGKPVLLYFSSIPIPPTDINVEQLTKLSKFQERCKNEQQGLVASYSSIDEFKKKLRMHITQKIHSIHKVDSGKKSPRYIEVVFAGVKEPKSLVATKLPKEIRNATVNPRVYDEKKLPSIGSTELPSYKWDADNFEEFWYDIEKGITSETLEIGGQHGNTLTETIDHNSRVIPENTLVYRTVKQAKNLKVIENGKVSTTDVDINKFDNGRYNLIGWQGQPYVAVKGKANKLAKLIIEQGSATTDRKMLAVGETWDIGDGWTISALSIDAKASPRQVWFVLSKDGIKLADKVVAQGQVYVYIATSFAFESDVPLFITYVDNIFAGATSDIVQLRYTWVISTSVTEIKASDVFGNLEVITADDDRLVLYNRDTPIVLPKGSAVDIMGDLKFKVADDSGFLRFYPVILREQYIGN
ncbi:MAG: S-layer protein domain-containing protein [Candidatus Methanoperedens sp.]